MKEAPQDRVRRRERAFTLMELLVVMAISMIFYALLPFDSFAAKFLGRIALLPVITGVSYELTDGTGLYGTVANGATAECSDCYAVGVTFGGTRPATAPVAASIAVVSRPWPFIVNTRFEAGS